MTIKGVGQDAPIVINPNGGMQSKSPYRCDLLDGKAMLRLAEVLGYGIQRYPEKDNWRKIEVDSHLNHALTHIFAHLAGDTQDDHLGHAFCRLMFAVALEGKEQN